MLGFDLDGVFLPDFKGPIEHVLAARTLCLPLFEPDVPWFLLTGRPRVDQPATAEWLSQFKNPPVAVYHDNHGFTIESAREYKASVLAKMSRGTRYIESDLGTVHYLRDKCHHISATLHSTLILRGLHEYL